MSPQPVLREFSFPRDYDAVVELWRGVDGVHVGPSDAPEEIQKKLERAPIFFSWRRRGIKSSAR